MYIGFNGDKPMRRFRVEKSRPNIASFTEDTVGGNASKCIPLRHGEEQSVKTTTAVPKAEVKASEF